MPLAPMRQEMPTLPCDLSEYARIHTGTLLNSEEVDDEDILESVVVDGPLLEAWLTRASL